MPVRRLLFQIFPRPPLKSTQCQSQSRLTFSLPSSAAAPPGKIFSTLTSGWVLEPFPPEILIPVRDTQTKSVIIQSEQSLLAVCAYSSVSTQEMEKVTCLNTWIYAYVLTFAFHSWEPGNADSHDKILKGESKMTSASSIILDRAFHCAFASPLSYVCVWRNLTW